MIGEHESVQQVSKDYKNVDQNQIHMQRYACEGEQARTLHLVYCMPNLESPSEILRFGWTEALRALSISRNKFHPAKRASSRRDSFLSRHADPKKG